MFPPRTRYTGSALFNRLMPWRSPRTHRWILGLAMFGIGYWLSALAARSAERYGSTLPSVPDVVLAHVPYRDLYFVGEIFFWVFLALLVARLVLERRFNFSYALFVIGAFSLLRALFLVLLPLGPPLTAPEFSARFHLYPYPFAYFPSGHVALLTILTLFLKRGWVRWLAWVGVIAFSIGTFFTRAHYSADALGAVVIAYAVYTFCERHVKPRWLNGQKRVTDVQPPGTAA